MPTRVSDQIRDSLASALEYVATGSFRLTLEVVAGCVGEDHLLRQLDPRVTPRQEVVLFRSVLGPNADLVDRLTVLPDLQSIFTAQRLF